MTAKPLAQIRWRPNDHLSALWWLGLLYRRPAQFQEAIQTLPTSKSFKASLTLYLHALVYVVLLSVLGRFVIFGLWGVAVTATALIPKGSLFLFHLERFIFALAGSVVILLSGRNGNGFPVRIAGGILFGLVFGMIGGIEHLIAFGIGGGLAFGFALGIALKKVVDEIIAVIFVAISTGIVFGIIVEPAVGTAFGLSAFIACFRVYHLLFWWLSWPMPRSRWYRYHPVAWDDLCLFPFPNFSLLLVAYTEFMPEKGEQEIERLINTYLSQKPSALLAKMIVLARKTARVKDLSQLDTLVAQLPEGRKGVLAQIVALRASVFEISHLQARLNTVTRPILREPLAQSLCERIENFHHQIAGFHEPLASEFRQASIHWLDLSQEQLRKVQAVTNKYLAPQVFRAGDPVICEHEAFVPRYGVVGDLEKLITLEIGCPGLVLYGRRRTGKSTILRNLSGFLPSTVKPILISMQDPQAFTSLTDWINLLARQLSTALDSAEPVFEAPRDLGGTMRMLAACDSYLQENGRHLLLAFDEYENFDRKLGEKVFPLDLLTAIRESIFAHRNLTWIFAGSHEIAELQHAEWPSYLVSARTIEVPLFTIDETRLLLTEPLKFSPLFKDESKRPRFEPRFWGENGIERIQHEAGGWPHLVQLIAETIVDVINDADQRQVDDALFERALNKAIVSGHNVLYQLLRGESTLPGEWEYLSAFRARETQPLPGEEALYISLRRRLLMEEANGEWRLRVPLMARWLKMRG